MSPCRLHAAGDTVPESVLPFFVMLRPPKYMQQSVYLAAVRLGQGQSLLPELPAAGPRLLWVAGAAQPAHWHAARQQSLPGRCCAHDARRPSAQL